MTNKKAIEKVVREINEIIKNNLHGCIELDVRIIDENELNNHSLRQDLFLDTLRIINLDTEQEKVDAITNIIIELDNIINKLESMYKKNFED